ncbi:MAG: hypothetical protein LBL08_00775 [Candidatus Nomurabacteria bacterium]|jgi:hypothetical protein|nr:hypothetical protein [Candidatus Nomurabacteria bacterium]
MLEKDPIYGVQPDNQEHKNDVDVDSSAEAVIGLEDFSYERKLLADWFDVSGDSSVGSGRYRIPFKGGGKVDWIGVVDSNGELVCELGDFGRVLASIHMLEHIGEFDRNDGSIKSVNKKILNSLVENLRGAFERHLTKIAGDKINNELDEQKEKKIDEILNTDMDYNLNAIWHHFFENILPNIDFEFQASIDRIKVATEESDDENLKSPVEDSQKIEFIIELYNKKAMYENRINMCDQKIKLYSDKHDEKACDDAAKRKAKWKRILVDIEKMISVRLYPNKVNDKNLLINALDAEEEKHFYKYAIDNEHLTKEEFEVHYNFESLKESAFEKIEKKWKALIDAQREQPDAFYDELDIDKRAIDFLSKKQLVSDEELDKYKKLQKLNEDIRKESKDVAERYERIFRDKKLIPVLKQALESVEEELKKDRTDRKLRLKRRDLQEKLDAVYLPDSVIDAADLDKGEKAFIREAFKKPAVWDYITQKIRDSRSKNNPYNKQYLKILESVGSMPELDQQLAQIESKWRELVKTNDTDGAFSGTVVNPALESLIAKNRTRFLVKIKEGVEHGKNSATYKNAEKIFKDGIFGTIKRNAPFIKDDAGSFLADAELILGKYYAIDWKYRLEKGKWKSKQYLELLNTVKGIEDDRKERLNHITDMASNRMEILSGEIGSDVDEVYMLPTGLLYRVGDKYTYKILPITSDCYMENMDSATKQAWIKTWTDRNIVPKPIGFIKDLKERFKNITTEHHAERSMYDAKKAELAEKYQIKWQDIISDDGNIPPAITYGDLESIEKALDALGGFISAIEKTNDKPVDWNKDQKNIELYLSGDSVKPPSDAVRIDNETNEIILSANGLDGMVDSKSGESAMAANVVTNQLAMRLWSTMTDAERHAFNALYGSGFITRSRFGGLFKRDIADNNKRTMLFSTRKFIWAFRQYINGWPHEDNNYFFDSIKKRISDSKNK